ncbi:MAG: PIG-L family deacetylase [Acidothermales bacterium]|nr:PIG-L family deacetylase [Acidothermales bacterium]
MAYVLSEKDVQQALVVAAHPDDIDFGVAGTVATWVDAGVKVAYCLVTDGDAGGFDADFPRAEMGPLRRREQTAAAAAVGVGELYFLGHPDGYLEPTLEVRRDIARVIRQVRPQRVVIPSPEINYERIFASHPDHRAAGTAALAAVYPDARNPFAFPELLAEGHEAWTVAETWLTAHTSSNQAVDVTEAFDRKIAALRAHESQIAHHEDLEGMIRGWLTANAEAYGLPEGRLAEAFYVMGTG